MQRQRRHHHIVTALQIIQDEIGHLIIHLRIVRKALLRFGQHGLRHIRQSEMRVWSLRTNQAR